MTGRQLTWGSVALAACAAVILLVVVKDDADDIAPDVAPHETPDGGGDAGLKARGRTEPDTPEPRLTREQLEDKLIAEAIARKEFPWGDDRIEGVVVDARGDPIHDADVWVRAKEGQPKELDGNWAWQTSVDHEGKWGISNTWASRSIVGAWAPGYETAFLEDLAVGTENRIVLHRAAPMTVIVRRPKPEPRRAQHVSALYVRVHLRPPKGVEHPRPGQPLTRTFDVNAELDKPVEIHVPKSERALITAGAWEWACLPAIAEWPSPSKQVEFTLVRVPTIRARLVDAKTKEPIPLYSGEGNITAEHAVTGYIPRTSSSDREQIWSIKRYGIGLGEHLITGWKEGYKQVGDPIRVKLTQPDQEVSVDIPIAREPDKAVLQVRMRYAEGSSGHGIAVRDADVFLRRREADPPVWRRAVGYSYHTEDDILVKKAGAWEAGTYDVIARVSGSAGAVAAHTGLKLLGGSDHRIDLALGEGYGFLPTNAVKPPFGELVSIRLEAPGIGALPLVHLEGDTHQTDAEGFSPWGRFGYVGLYPWPELTLVERKPDGTLKRHTLKAAISPSK